MYNYKNEKCHSNNYALFSEGSGKLPYNIFNNIDNGI